MYGRHRYFFNSRMEAEDALRAIKDVASTYACVTIDDVNEICGRQSSYLDTENGWLDGSLENVYVLRGRYNYHFELPRPVPITADEPEIFDQEDTNNSTTEPIHITIHTKEVGDIDEVLDKTFKHIHTIKDRMVSLTIM